MVARRAWVITIELLDAAAHARRTPDGLIAAAASALRQVKAQHCVNYFAAYGYGAT
jgi:hypothetical protein